MWYVFGQSDNIAQISDNIFDELYSVYVQCRELIGDKLTLLI